MQKSHIIFNNVRICSSYFLICRNLSPELSYHITSDGRSLGHESSFVQNILVLQTSTYIAALGRIFPAVCYVLPGRWQGCVNKCAVDWFMQIKCMRHIGRNSLVTAPEIHQNHGGATSSISHNWLAGSLTPNHGDYRWEIKYDGEDCQKWVFCSASSVLITNSKQSRHVPFAVKLNVK